MKVTKEMIEGRELKPGEEVVIPAKEVPEDIRTLFVEAAALAEQGSSMMQQGMELMQKAKVKSSFGFVQVEERYPQLDRNDAVLGYRFTDCGEVVVVMAKPAKPEGLSEFLRRMM